MKLIHEAAWWVADYLYAAWWRVRAALSHHSPSEFASGDRNPILIIPGVYEPWRFMLPLIRALHETGHPVHVVAPLRTNRMPIPAAARLVEEYLATQELRDTTLVAHSKGGLIGKHVMSFGDAERRVRGMVAIATPFGGSRYARLLPGRTLRAFRPGDATLTLLATSFGVNSRIVSVFAEFDPHIPEGSELDGATNVRVPTGGHFRILSHPRTVAEAKRCAGDSADPGDPG